MADVVTCPYCRTTGRRRDLLLNCVPACGNAVPFRVAELRGGRCPHHRAPRARRCCPACGRDLPRGYVDSVSRDIVVIGPEGAGKSTWVAAVVRALEKGELLWRFPGMSVDLLGDSSRTGYRRYFEPLLAGRTPAGVCEDPLLLSVSPRMTSVVLAMYDMAGAAFSTARAGQLAPYVAEASGILLVLDPVEAPEIGPLLGRSTGVAAPFADLCGALGGLVREPSRTPLAVVLSKLDTVWEMFDERASCRLPSAHVGHYTEADGLDVHDEVCAWLDHWYGPDLVRAVAAGFPVHRYFGLSALGAGACPVAHRVEDPILWLLGRFGAIRTWRGRR
jgi:hypothetical protein